MNNPLLADLLCALRQRLLDDLQKDDREDLGLLCTTFGVLREVSYASENEAFTVVVFDLEYSAQHGAMGVKVKAFSAIPSVEVIRSACSTP